MRRNKRKTTDSARRARRSRHDNGKPVSRCRVRTDAGPSIFLENELEAMLSEVYREELPSLRIFDFIPVSTEIPAGAETIAYRQYTPFGMAAVIRQPSQDIPRVDIMSEKFTSPVHEIAVAYGYTISELESAAMAQLPLDREKGMIAKDAVARTESSIAINGGADFGVPNLPGILSNANIPTATVANPGGGTEWVNKTADQTLTDMRDSVSTMVADTLGIEIPDTMLLPIAQYEHISGLRVGDTGETVLSHFLRTNPHIKRIDWLRELDGAGAGASDVMLLLTSNPSKLKYHMPLPFQQRPAQERNMEIVINCRAKSGGVVIQKPLSLSISEGI